ncbi:MAG: hypothetical protein ACREHD_15220, partial [Pirellulales bacterium]
MGEVTLWDGRVYDAEALAARYPALASYAAEAAACEELTFAESFPSPSMRYMRTSAAALVDALCLLSIPIIFLVVLGCGWSYVLLDLTGVGLVLASIDVHRWSTREAEHVSIRDGEIRMSRREGCVRLPLKDCFWYLGAYCHNGTQAF